MQPDEAATTPSDTPAAEGTAAPPPPPPVSQSEADEIPLDDLDSVAGAGPRNSHFS